MAQVKRIKKQLDELKPLYAADHKTVIFILDDVLFDIDNAIDFDNSTERLITGRIFPTSGIFKQGAFKIEIKLPPVYPLDPPKVRFLTRIYHPNVGIDGGFRHEFLQKTARWMSTASLVDVIKVVLERIDNPDVDCAVNQEVAEEYSKNRNEFNRKALETVMNHSLPRN